MPVLWTVELAQDHASIVDIGANSGLFQLKIDNIERLSATYQLEYGTKHIKRVYLSLSALISNRSMKFQISQISQKLQRGSVAV